MTKVHHGMDSTEVTMRSDFKRDGCAALVARGRSQGAFRTFASVTLLFGLLLVTGACADSAPETTPVFPDNSFALYALSRGKGVPAPARQAMQRVRGLLEEARQRGDVLSLVQTRIGLEGETRLCATFATSDAARAAWVQARRFVEGTDLVNLVIEPCAKQ
jgi:hypothetical protein